MLAGDILAATVLKLSPVCTDQQQAVDSAGLAGKTRNIYRWTGPIVTHAPRQGRRGETGTVSDQWI
jgi:hypothetical protein